MDEFLARVRHCYQDFLGSNLVSLVVFGSYARGEAAPGSDCDILLVAKGLPERKFERLLFVRGCLQGQFERRLSILPKTPEEIDFDIPPLYLDIAVDGIILLDRDDFMKTRLERIRNIMKEATLIRIQNRVGELVWSWQTPPRSRQWELTWNGYREF